ncbi:MAG TPA: hypothetical protein DCM31_01705 [Deferribacteraceae bacterium]|nr:hypothetical protein [Deferribacteraceae bacterium]
MLLCFQADFRQGCLKIFTDDDFIREMFSCKGLITEEFVNICLRGVDLSVIMQKYQYNKCFYHIAERRVVKSAFYGIFKTVC